MVEHASSSSERDRCPPSGHLEDQTLLKTWLESHQGLRQSPARLVLEKLLAAGREESLSWETREGLMGVVSLLKEVIGGTVSRTVFIVLWILFFL